MSAPFILLGLCAIAVLAWAHASGVVYVGRTMAGLTIVRDDNRVMDERIRVLAVRRTYQSATYLDERWADPVFPYHLMFDHVFDAWPAGDGPATMAVLGGGGYAVPKHLIAHHPQVSRLDVVEIDPAIERIARRFFFVDRLEELWQAESSGRLRLHVADAYDWLTASDERFDAIINDCFCALAPEASLMNPTGAKLVASRLKDGGVYLTNVVSSLEGPDATLLYETIAALQQAFSHVWVYPCSADEPAASDNNIVIATDAPHYFAGAWEWPSTTEENQ